MLVVFVIFQKYQNIENTGPGLKFAHLEQLQLVCFSKNMSNIRVVLGKNQKLHQMCEFQARACVLQHVKQQKHNKHINITSYTQSWYTQSYDL
jgi:hypothetical protein